jgi:hypothetical protein
VLTGKFFAGKSLRAAKVRPLKNLPFRPISAPAP